jgi:hypothetical protein
MMHCVRKLVFAVSLVALSWYGMMAVHEMGHVVGAWGTGGTVTRVFLHPLSISRTDVLPNPSPGIVVWLGPIIGSLLPLLLLACGRFCRAETILGFFAGFCLIANGAYISMGSLEGIGDAGEMLRCGAPLWTLIVFGAIAVSGGLMIWHRLGSPGRFFAAESTVTWRMVMSVIIALFLLLLTEFVLFAE